MLNFSICPAETDRFLVGLRGLATQTHQKAVESAYGEKTLFTFDLCLCRSVVMTVKC